MEVPGMKADGACQVFCGNLLALAALEEEKNEIGAGGSDPSHQCGLGFRLYYARENMKPIRNSCCCPTFLIALAGPWICVLGAVFVDHVVVQELTDFIWIGGHPYNDDKLKSVARILAALGEGIAELEDFYSKLAPHNSQQDSQRFFPFIRQYSIGEHVVRFTYQAYLISKTPQSHFKPIFLAATTSDGERGSHRNIVVKFVQTYNARAHRLLADAGRAPELLYCSKEDPNSEDLGGLIMVVMGYVHGKTAHGANPLPRAVFDQVHTCRTLRLC